MNNYFIGIFLVTAAFLNFTHALAPPIIDLIGYQSLYNGKDVRLTYNDRQLVVFMCGVFDEGSVEIRYTPQDGEPVSSIAQTKTFALTYLYVTMTRAQHHSIVECLVKEGDGPQRSVQRVIFDFDPRTSLRKGEVWGFDVDGMILPAFVDRNMVVTYPCAVGEVMNIRFIYDKTDTNSVSCRFNGPIRDDPQYAGYFNESIAKFQVEYKNEYKTSELICSVRNEFNTTDYSMKFEHRPDIPVSGFSFSKSLFMYLNADGSNFNDTVLTVAYEYETSSNLICNPTTWRFNNNEVTCLEQGQYDLKTCSFYIFDGYRSTTVQCANMKMKLLRK